MKKQNFRAKIAWELAVNNPNGLYTCLPGIYVMIEQF